MCGSAERSSVYDHVEVNLSLLEIKITDNYLVIPCR